MRLAAPNNENTISTNQLNVLLTDGYVNNPLSLVNTEKIKKLQNYFIQLPCYDPASSNRSEFLYTNPPKGTRLGFLKHSDVIYAPDLLEIISDNNLKNLAEGFFGGKVSIDYIGAWWSFPTNSSDGTQFFHRDVDSLNFLKFFIYLTDVNEFNGPHIIVKSSQNDDIYLKKYANYPDATIINYSKKYSRPIDTLEGHAGTNFLENTFCLHKGAAPQTNPRLLLQVIFSLANTPYGPKKPYADYNALQLANPNFSSIDREYLKRIIICSEI
jgi:hypothetical protein